MNEQVKCVHLIVEGLVQGVGFRFFTWQTAQQLGVLGWVRNRDDGAVEIRAEGSESSIDRFVKIIKKGNPYSRVERANVRPYDSPEHFSSFEIRY
ncbi:MAG: acylphosphatase [Sporolactobacillus sp.]|jgi:acylphosphatase|nr:acylphosphatase [Sporolactobacillus sp.]